MTKEEIILYNLEAKYIELSKNKVSDEMFIYPYGWNKIHEKEVKIRMLAEALQKGILLFETDEYLKYCESAIQTLHK